jgi:carboxypeptidase Q
MNLKITLGACFTFASSLLFAQNQNDSLMIRKIYDEALTNGKSYQNLDYLCNKIGGRVSGSAQAQQAVDWGKKVMDEMGLDRVFLQEVMVPHWVRGAKEQGKIISKSMGTKEVPLCALGGSIATPIAGLKAEVIEVHSLDEVAKLGKAAVKGKIVFFNRPMDPKFIATGHAYGAAVDQRGGGAIAAAKMGAVGVIVRSMTLSEDDVPHTGAMHYDDKVTKIPSAAISTKAANLLSDLLKKEPKLQFFYKMNCETLPDVKSYNVVGEIKGTEHPEEIIVVGGHLDSWDTGKGAHDDGSGAVQSMEVLRIMKAMGYKPKRTVRAVLFMNEENGLRGGKKYAELAKQNNEKHIVGIETDAGGFEPKGYTIGAKPDKMDKILSWKPLLEPYGIGSLIKGGGGADTSPMEAEGLPCLELRPDSQRYFDYHHTPIDTFDKVNKRELELGGAALATMVYLFSEYGL